MNLHPIPIYGPVPKLWKREPLLSSHIPKWKKAATLILFIFLTVEPLLFLSFQSSDFIPLAFSGQTEKISTRDTYFLICTPLP